MVSRGLWIGSSDAGQEGAYQWVSSEDSSFRQWWPGEPFALDETWDYVDITWPSVTHPGEWRNRQDLSHYLGLPICGVVEVVPVPPPLMLSVLPAVELSWLSKTNQFYQVQWRSNVGTNEWMNLGEAVPGNGRVNRVFDSTGGTGMKLYRVIEVDMGISDTAG